MIRTVLVDTPRLARALARTPRLADRILTTAERLDADGRARRVDSLAARWAAKCAVAALLGDLPSQVEILTAPTGAPTARCTTTAVRISLAHAAGTAVAMAWADAPRREPLAGRGRPGDQRSSSASSSSSSSSWGRR